MSKFTAVTWVIWWIVVATVATSCSVLGAVTYSALVYPNMHTKVIAIMMWLVVVAVLVLGRKRQ